MHTHAVRTGKRHTLGNVFIADAFQVVQTDQSLATLSDVAMSQL